MMWLQRKAPRSGTTKLSLRYWLRTVSSIRIAINNWQEFSYGALLCPGISTLWLTPQPAVLSARYSTASGKLGSQQF